MKFHLVDHPWYRIVSEHGRLKLGRTVKDAEPNEAFYHVAWDKAHGLVRAREETQFNPPIMRISINYADLKSNMNLHVPELPVEEEGVFLDALGRAVCELSRIKKGKAAEILSMQFIAEFTMPDGGQRICQNGRFQPAVY
jgi:hypothetical protein